ncbi:MAG: hypothetical protein GWM98_13310, partial [Nitrospinaceae bacterium]|nr:hypothetical protein [Nitrospinaceae bacterium]NIR55269.1 hypothetical protein [Nitrospinaceae bacterium]NIS85707.1 hypothetical protein [Nitrospinaceae bacterium]NIT82558.1 hypothetical protein [Nitrospinaceae bacterium]NIU44762.1 hypothetical protein [Nitrospinaceae bacterium]
SSALGADREAYEEKGDHAGKKEGSGIFPLGSFHERYEDKEKEPRKTGMEKGRGTEPAGSGKREEGSGMR